MPKPTKAELTKYRKLLEQQLASLSGDVDSMKDEALRASDQDSSVDHLADQGTDNYDQGFLLGLVENEEETIQLIHDAIDRLDGNGDFAFGECQRCRIEADEAKAAKSKKKIDTWIPKPRLEYLPWAKFCVTHQQEQEENREIA